MKKSEDYFSLVFILIVLFILIFVGNVISGRVVERELGYESSVELLEKIKPFDEIAKQQRIIKILKEGESIIILGTLDVIHFDNFVKQISENQYFLTEDSGKKFRVYFNRELQFVSGTELVVEGKSLGGEIVSKSYEVVFEEGVTAIGENPNLGEQSTIVILVNSIDNPIEPITVEEAWNKVFDENSYGSINSWVKEVSYEQASLTGDVFGWYTLDVVSTSPAIAAADSDVYFPDYSRLIIIVADGSGGQGTIGAVEVETDDGPVNLSLSIIYGVENINTTGIHELGHNLGLYHANDLECGDAVFGDVCMSVQYGDLFDVMGTSSQRGHFSANHKEIIGWLDPSDINETNTWGTYFIEPIESLGVGVKTLKIPTGIIDPITGRDVSYYIEYRRPLGYDSINSDEYGTEIYDGAMLHLDFSTFGGDIQLLDSSPHENWNDPADMVSDSLDVVLKEGETFYDFDNDVVISTIDVTDNYLEIFLGLQNCGDGIINFPEECDGLNLDGQTCDSIGYKNGDLGCTQKCKFDVSQCGEPICGEGHTYNGGDFCTAVFIADPEGTGILVDNSLGEDWDELRNRDTGNEIGLDYFFLLFSDPNPSSLSSIYRISIPFDTNSLPDSAIIDSAELTLTKVFSFIGNTHPDSNDFITLVPTTLETPPFLTLDDFDQFSFIDNPIELSDRLDFGGLGFFPEKLTFLLNENGLSNINLVGFSGYGLRGGYDLFTTPNDGEYTLLAASFNSGSALWGKPTLIVNYTVLLELQPPLLESNPINKNRYLSFIPQNSGKEIALKVTITNLLEPFSSLNGATAWVGPPKDISMNGASVEPLEGFGIFKASSLECPSEKEIHYQDWGEIDLLNVFGSEIIPNATYEIQATEDGITFSDSLTIRTSKWGDIIGDFSDKPDGNVNINDVLAIIQGFQTTSDAIIKTRTDIEPGFKNLGDPETPDQLINIVDAVSALGAFNGIDYSEPFGIETCDGSILPSNPSGGPSAVTTSSEEAIELAKTEANCPTNANYEIGLTLTNSNTDLAYVVDVGGKVYEISPYNNEVTETNKLSITSSCTKASKKLRR